MSLCLCGRLGVYASFQVIAIAGDCSRLRQPTRLVSCLCAVCMYRYLVSHVSACVHEST